MFNPSLTLSRLVVLTSLAKRKDSDIPPGQSRALLYWSLHESEIVTVIK